MRRKRTFKETIEDHDKQIAWQRQVIREEMKELEKMKAKKDK